MSATQIDTAAIKASWDEVGQMCPPWMGSAIRHVVRNCDIDCQDHEDCENRAGRYDGYAIATVFNAVPQLLAEIERLKKIELAVFGPRQ